MSDIKKPEKNVLSGALDAAGAGATVGGLATLVSKSPFVGLSAFTIGASASAANSISESRAYGEFFDEILQAMQEIKTRLEAVEGLTQRNREELEQVKTQASEAFKMAFGAHAVIKDQMGFDTRKPYGDYDAFKDPPQRPVPMGGQPFAPTAPSGGFDFVPARRGGLSFPGGGQNVIQHALQEIMQGMLKTAFPARGAGGDMTVRVVNNTALSVSAQERRGSDGRRELEIMIDEMVARSLSRGHQTTSVLGSIFGLSPRLIGR